MARHRQERVASESGLRLVVGSNTAASDELLHQLIDESNRGLYTLVRQVVAMSTRSTGNDGDQSMVHGLPADFPISVQLGKVLRAKTNVTEVSGQIVCSIQSFGLPLVGLVECLCAKIDLLTRENSVVRHQTSFSSWATDRIHAVQNEIWGLPPLSWFALFSKGKFNSKRHALEGCWWYACWRWKCP